jgi:hypothetical protein
MIESPLFRFPFITAAPLFEDGFEQPAVLIAAGFGGYSGSAGAGLAEKR